MDKSRFDPVTQQFNDPKDEENAKHCDDAREVEVHLRAEEKIPPSYKGRHTKKMRSIATMPARSKYTCAQKKRFLRATRVDTRRKCEALRRCPRGRSTLARRRKDSSELQGSTHEENAKHCDDAREVEVHLRAEEKIPPSYKG